jgi:hypothetical protein
MMQLSDRVTPDIAILARMDEGIARHHMQLVANLAGEDIKTVLKEHGL